MTCADRSGAWVGQPRSVPTKEDLSIDDFVWAPNNNTIYFTADAWGRVLIHSVQAQTGVVTQVIDAGSAGSVSLEGE